VEGFQQFRGLKVNERVKTQNGCGWTTDQSNPITDEMLEFIAASESPTILDIGAAYGVATLPALRAGATVVANDIESSHLVHIVRMASQENLEGRLTTHLGRFPFVDDIEKINAIHCSNVLRFLSGKELLLAFAYAIRALLPGGKIFIQVGTPYAGHVRRFIPIYEERLRRGDPWPGEIEDTRPFLAEEIRDEVPRFLHLLDRETLCGALQFAGFHIEHASCYSRPGLPEVCRNDGRENFGVVASLRAT
jgi:SAM-dependent methyltransferase